MSARRVAIRRACAAGSIPLYAADLATTRGKCLRRRCGGRWAVTRVSLDFTGERVDRLATLECALCGTTWRRVKPPALRSEAGYQAVRLTLILPRSARRWRTRGRWHRDGDDALVVREADLGDLDEAARAHNRRADRLADLRAARKAKIEAENAALVARYRAIDEASRTRREEREREEREAAAREAAMSR